MEEPESSQRWVVLLCFSYTAGCNAFMFMNFSTVAAISEDLLNVNNAALDWLYSVSLVTVCVSALFASWGLVRYNWTTNLLGVLMNSAGAWLRWIAVLQGSYTVAMLSSVVIGGAASVVVCSYAMIGEQWFAPNQRSLATSFAVQSSTAGWALGCLIPVVVTNDASLRTFCLSQALAISVSIPIFLMSYRRPATAHPPPHHPADDTLTTSLAASPLASLMILVRNPRYAVYTMCFSLVGGASFSIPAVQDLLFSDCGAQALHHSQTRWTNLTFILSGVVGGILLGAFVRDSTLFRPVIAALFVLTALALLGLCLLTTPLILDQLSNTTLFASLLPLMALAGFGSVGFIGLGLRVAVEAGRPVSEAYTGGAVEWWIQVWGTVFTQVSGCGVRFAASAAAVVAAALVMLLLLHTWKAPLDTKRARLLNTHCEPPSQIGG